MNKQKLLHFDFQFGRDTLFSVNDNRKVSPVTVKFPNGGQSPFVWAKL